MRRRDGRDVSEANPRVRAAMAGRMDAWPSATTIDTTSRTAAESVWRALRELAASR